MRPVTITSDYHITIPQELREKYDLKPGQQVRFEWDGKVILVHFEETSETSRSKRNVPKVL